MPYNGRGPTTLPVDPVPFDRRDRMILFELQNADLAFFKRMSEEGKLPPEASMWLGELMGRIIRANPSAIGHGHDVPDDDDEFRDGVSSGLIS